MANEKKSRKQVNNANARWRWIRTMIQDELDRVQGRYPKSYRIDYLKQLLAAAKGRDEVKMIELAPVYARRSRRIPPGIYAMGQDGSNLLLLPGDRLPAGTKISHLTFGVIHAQIYR